MDRSLPPPAGTRPVGYRFAEFRLDAEGTLLRGETAIELPREELALLRALLARSGEVVSGDELTRALWGEADPSSQRLTACLKSLKARLRSADCIEGVYRHGYRIAATVEPEGPLRSSALPLLAILPFSTGYEVAEYLGLAIAEQTIEQLSRARPAVASIAAPDSACTLARHGLSAQEIGKMLHAELILTGQILATPGRHRLRVEAMRMEDGASLWVEDLIAEREQIGELAGELVNRVTSRLRAGEIPIEIEAGVEARAGAMPAVKRATSQAQREALDLYLRAHYERQNMERHRMQDAMGRLLRAIELDPALMAARVELAQLVILQCVYGYLSPRIAAATVRRAADGIPELNEQAEALLPALGWVEFHFDRDARSALRMMARSAGLPNELTNTRARSWFLLSRHRFDEAIELIRANIQNDPYSPWLQASLAWALHLAGEREASLKQIRKAIDFSSEYDNSLFIGAMILGYNGEAARAIELAETLAARSSHYDLAISAHAYALACAGRAEESHSQLERLQWLSRERFVLNTLNAATHVVLGEADAALEELRTADENRCPWFFQMLADPRLKPLRGRTEFAALESLLATMEVDASA
ncbi:MAG: winged helix-turn-helix domain-containing protein [Terracidiphilus sp.]|jgi:DNA-binding winged helix-turn-helix (wHTH) protein